MPTSSQTSVIRISPHTIQPKSTIVVNSPAQVCCRGSITNQSAVQWHVERHPSVVVSSHQQHGHILERALTTVEIVSDKYIFIININILVFKYDIYLIEWC